MPQTDAYLCETDIIQVAKLLFQQEAAIIPDLDYSRRELLQISDLKSLQRLLDDSIPLLLFAVSPKWQRSPLEMQSTIKQGKKVFFVVQKSGGPSIDIFYPRPLEVRGSLAIPHGFVAYHDCYWNAISK